MTAPRRVPLAGGVAFGLGGLAAVIMGPIAPSRMLGAGVLAGGLVLAVGTATVLDKEAIAVASAGLAAATAGFLVGTVPLTVAVAADPSPAFPTWALLALAVLVAAAGAFLRRRRRREALRRT